MSNNTATFQARWLGNLRARAVSLLTYLASPVARLSMIAIAALVLAYALYSNVWQPLQRSGELPSGVSPVNPQITTDRLQVIIESSTTRQQKIRSNFVRYGALFAPRRN